ncbi:Tigger transposable element-derived protein 4 [Araneus ventricosus]|uniref:Tigger transposable element-derived protein 4 n=1 Tax=Araneus ventricosus TaxID=182803 RepID=A0A4Y2CRP9_ARAVE|nr:Tigger transposable element-derived protein 4 [Araneus ventricosus]
MGVKVTRTHIITIPTREVRTRLLIRRLLIRELAVPPDGRWLHKFKLRYGLTGKTVSGESGDVDCETVDDWIRNILPDLIKGYEQKVIFNADETGLFYKLLPSKTLAIKSDTCHGGKNSKVRLAVSLCANADGSEKLAPLIIGKSKKPRCFKKCENITKKYLSNKKSWMTMSFFTDWLKGLDNKM